MEKVGEHRCPGLFSCPAASTPVQARSRMSETRSESPVPSVRERGRRAGHQSAALPSKAKLMLRTASPLPDSAFAHLKAPRPGFFPHSCTSSIARRPVPPLSGLRSDSQATLSFRRAVRSGAPSPRRLSGFPEPEGFRPNRTPRLPSFSDHALCRPALSALQSASYRTGTVTLLPLPKLRAPDSSPTAALPPSPGVLSRLFRVSGCRPSFRACFRRPDQEPSLPRRKRLAGKRAPGLFRPSAASCGAQKRHD